MSVSDSIFQRTQLQNPLVCILIFGFIKLLIDLYSGNKAGKTSFCFAKII